MLLCLVGKIFESENCIGGSLWQMCGGVLCIGGGHLADVCGCVIGVDRSISLVLNLTTFKSF